MPRGGGARQAALPHARRRAGIRRAEGKQERAPARLVHGESDRRAETDRGVAGGGAEGAEDDEMSACSPLDLAYRRRRYTSLTNPTDATVISAGRVVSGRPRLGRVPVKRILLPWMFDVAAALDSLDRVQIGDKYETHWYALYDAKNQIEAVFTQSIYGAHLRISRQKAGELHAQLESIIGDGSQTERELINYEVWLLKSKRDQFKTVFLSELSALPLFLVSEREGYDINLLIEEGTRLFPPTLAKKAPEAIRDAMEVGKAIAFELPTAAGFHIFRVVEAVLKRYWDHVTSKIDRPKVETIGNFAAEMERLKFGDAKILESLKQLGKLHRNPLIHPEIILDVGEELETLGISRSVVGAMLRVLPDIPTTTATALPPPQEAS